MVNFVSGYQNNAVVRVGYIQQFSRTRVKTSDVVQDFARCASIAHQGIYCKTHYNRAPFNFTHFALLLALIYVQNSITMPNLAVIQLMRVIKWPRSDSDGSYVKINVRGNKGFYSTASHIAHLCYLALIETGKFCLFQSSTAPVNEIIDSCFNLHLTAVKLNVLSQFHSKKYSFSIELNKILDRYMDGQEATRPQWVTCVAIHSRGSADIPSLQPIGMLFSPVLNDQSASVLVLNNQP